MGTRCMRPQKRFLLSRCGGKHCGRGRHHQFLSGSGLFSHLSRSYVEGSSSSSSRSCSRSSSRGGGGVRICLFFCVPTIGSNFDRRHCSTFLAWTRYCTARRNQCRRCAAGQRSDHHHVPRVLALRSSCSMSAASRRRRPCPSAGYCYS